MRGKEYTAPSDKVPLNDGVTHSADCWKWHRECFLRMLGDAFDAYVEADSPEGARDVVGALANRLYAWGGTHARPETVAEVVVRKTADSPVSLTPSEIMALPLNARHFILACAAEVARLDEIRWEWEQALERVRAGNEIIAKLREEIQELGDDNDAANRQIDDLTQAGRLVLQSVSAIAADVAFTAATEGANCVFNLSPDDDDALDQEITKIVEECAQGMDAAMGTDFPAPCDLLDPFRALRDVIGD